MTRFYRALLRLYPAGFRAEYGDQLCAAFEERVRRGSRAAAVGGAILDVATNASAAHFDILKQDLRYALRSLLRSPGFALTAIVVVALGVGANTAAFSLADFVLLRPLPFPRSEELVKLWNASQDYQQNEASPAQYRDWKGLSTSFSGMAAYTRSAANLVGQGAPVRLEGARVTPELQQLVGVQARIGSIITPENTRDGAVVVLSDGLWRTQFGGDQRVVGRTVRLDGKPHVVVGVMPPGYTFPSRETELWTSLIFTGQDYEDRGDNYLYVIGRLKPGATLQSARTDMATVSARIKKQYPEDDPQAYVWMYLLRDDLSSKSRMLVLALCGAALCVFLLACANLASLLLARGVSRTRELSIRTALGAGRERLVRQLLTESIVLAALGALAGVALAHAGLPLLTALVPTSLPVEELPTIDLRVLALAAVAITLTGLGFGVIPALRRQDVRRRRIRSALVVVEITGSIVLLIVSGLLMRAIWKIQAVPPGFNPDNVMTLRTALPLPKYGITTARQRFYQRVLDELRALPGIDGAAYTTGLPMVRTGGIWGIEIAGMDERQLRDNAASVRYVTSGYFATLGIPLKAGRDVADTDSAARPYVAVVSESAARKHWPNQDPIGRRFKIALSERTVVGVVGDVRVRGLERANEPQVYLASGQVDDNSIIGYIPQDLVVKSSLPPAQWLPAARRIIAAADPEQPVSNVKALGEIVADDTAPRRVQLRLLAILSAIALLIAAVGVHGLLSFAVAQRTKEFGIRLALGAEATEIVGMVLRDGLRLVLTGALIGLAIAFYAGRAMSALLFGVPPTDPLTMTAAVAICVVTALLGCMRPAVRAARVDPMVALREA